MPKALKLTEHQQLFLKQYLVLGNATEALLATGYKGKHPAKAASQLMHKPFVKQAIEKNRLKVEQKTLVTFEWKVNKLQEIIDQAQSSEQYRDAVAAMAELNKMQGHYAPEKQVNYNVDVTLENIRNARLEYKKEY